MKNRADEKLQVLASDWNLDLSLLSFGEWVNFFFQRPPIPEGKIFLDLISDDFISFEASKPGLIVDYLTRCCRNFDELTKRFSLAELNQGVWAMFGGGGVRIQDHLWDKSVPITHRIKCIISMRFPILAVAKSFPNQPIETGFYMWWDLILHDFWAQYYHWDRKYRLLQKDKYDLLPDDHKMLLDAALVTLSKLLEENNEGIQACAQHGLGHLHHPAVPAIIDQFIKRRHRKLSNDELLWLKACATGSVL